MSTTTDFVTIKEAAERYRKAEITIRRFVRSVVQADNKAEREGVSPSPAEVQKLKKKSKPFSYKISADLLEKHFGVNAEGKAAKPAARSGSGEYLTLLERTNQALSDQLQVKDDQIRALNQSLDEMTARQREANILMKGLQEQFLLASGKASPVKAAEPTAKRRRWLW